MTKNEALEVARGITGECSCDVAYTSRKLVAPDCIFHECAEDIAQALLDAVQSEREAIVKICEANLTILPQHDAKRGSFNICEGVPGGFDNRAVLTILPQHDAKRGKGWNTPDPVGEKFAREVVAILNVHFKGKSNG